ncbi:2OG-Fe(II) oxygenase [Sphingomonas sp.]|uniref:2OG-Fe(II) oxygenase n=1 Tax=Sphingomonas sp. TaxID=28214 RepID=UPI0025E791DB|nr:2OG-Fe(II) oxygenase [Sphingomonas sp.]
MATDRLADIGRNTAARLNRNPAVQMVAGQGIELYVHENFLTLEECGGLVAMIDADRKPSALLSQTDDAEFRTSESCDLDRWNPFVEMIDRRICALMGMKPKQGETMQGQRYDVGQQFKAHHDYFHVGEDYWIDQKKRGGQRSWTAMIYLDEPESGGETWFSAAGLRVSPRTGMLLAWNNTDRQGAVNAQALHESLPVMAGLKNVVTKWFRERYWVT